MDMSMPSKGGPVLNMFLCYFRSPGHNRKPRMSTFGGVSMFTCSFTSVCPRLPAFANAHTHHHTPHTHTPTRLWRQSWTMFLAIQPRTHKSDILRLTEDKMANFCVKLHFHTWIWHITRQWGTWYFKGKRGRISQMQFYIILR